VYLETVLHGSNLASASKVTTWFGTSYLTPIFGAIIADTFLGNYNTILVSLAVYVLVRLRSFTLIHASIGRVNDANRFFAPRAMSAGDDVRDLLGVPAHGCGAGRLLGVGCPNRGVRRAVPRRDRERRGAVVAAAVRRGAVR